MKEVNLDALCRMDKARSKEVASHGNKEKNEQKSVAGSR